jgi:pimeloyl-ACP methyl ester carboxylesterase
MKTPSSSLPLRTDAFEQVYEYSRDHRFFPYGKERSRLLAAAILSFTGVGMVYQSFATACDRIMHPPPGRLLDVGGCRLHLQSAGSGTPTVVLEAGLGGMSSAWAWVQSETAGFTHVVSYDRAGLGWSESDVTPKTAVLAARRLRSLLQSANTPPPYVLVGHSMGGFFIRVFADLFPKEVAGLVLVDASHPDQQRRSSAIETHMCTGFRMLRGVPVLARVGYIRLSGFFDSWAEGLPDKQAAEAKAFLSSYRHLKTTRDESRAWDTICAEVRSTAGLGDKPLVVVTAGKDILPGHPELQSELAALSSNSVHWAVKGADHVTLVTHRQHASTVVEAIQHVVRTWKGRLT